MTADVARVIGTFFADPPNYRLLTYKVTNDRDSRTLVHLCTCVCARSRSMHNRYCSYESGQAHRSNVSAAILILVNEERDLLCTATMSMTSLWRYSHFIQQTCLIRKM